MKRKEHNGIVEGAHYWYFKVMGSSQVPNKKKGHNNETTLDGALFFCLILLKSVSKPVIGINWNFKAEKH